MLPEIKKREEQERETRGRSILIEKGAVDVLPPDAVIISKQEALQLQYDMVYNWENKSDIWPFRWGLGILSGAVAISSIFITNYYRQRTKLFHYGRLPMYLPTVVLPSIFLPIVYQRVVAEPIFLQDRCPICIEVRSIALQFAFGIVYPTLLASVTSFTVVLLGFRRCTSYLFSELYINHGSNTAKEHERRLKQRELINLSCLHNNEIDIASYYGTCDIPLFTGLNLLEMGRAWARISSRFNSRIFWVWPMHAVVAATITYMQANSFYKIQRSIIQREKQMYDEIINY